MAVTKKKRSAHKIAATASPAGKTRNGRRPQAEIRKHVDRFRELQFKRGADYTQAMYARENGITEGTFSRWMSENPPIAAAAENGERPVRGLLPASTGDGVQIDAAPSSKAAAKAAEREAKAQRELREAAEALGAKVTSLEAERASLRSQIQELSTRNVELKTAVKALSGSL